MKVLYFGTYERDYPRNRQVISSLRRAGVEVTERHEPVWEEFEHKWAPGFGAVLRLGRAQARLLTNRESGSFDVIVVGYPGHLDVPAARRAARGAPVVLNPLVSLWETFVEDRRRFRRDSLAARALREIDRRAFRTADLVVADTAANAGFFADLADLSTEEVSYCFVGAEERLFVPGWRPVEPPLFVGKLIPLHGLETILAAARLVPDLPIRIVGSGQEDHLVRRRPKSVQYVSWIDYEALPAEYRRASCALGIFGTGAKAARVIPNKAFQALACGTPLVTANTSAARELLVHRDSALLVPPGDPRALADALRELADDTELARGIAERGLETYRRHASEDVLGRRWKKLLSRLVERDPARSAR